MGNGVRDAMIWNARSGYEFNSLLFSSRHEFYLSPIPLDAIDHVSIPDAMNHVSTLFNAPTAPYTFHVQRGLERSA